MDMPGPKWHYKHWYRGQQQLLGPLIERQTSQQKPNERHKDEYVCLAPTGTLGEAMLSLRVSVRPFPQIMSSSSILQGLKNKWAGFSLKASRGLKN